MLKGGSGKGCLNLKESRKRCVGGAAKKPPSADLGISEWDLRRKAGEAELFLGAEDVIQARDGDGLDQGGRSGVGQKSSKSGCILFPQKM